MGHLTPIMKTKINHIKILEVLNLYSRYEGKESPK